MRRGAQARPRTWTEPRDAAGFRPWIPLVLAAAGRLLVAGLLRSAGNAGSSRGRNMA